MKVSRDSRAKPAFFDFEKSINGNKLVISVPYILQPFKQNSQTLQRRELSDIKIRGIVDFNLNIEW